MMSKHPYSDISPTDLADILPHTQVMDIAIRPLWQPIPRIAGPVFTVHCCSHDNVMLHAAIYRAEPGSVIVVESDELDYAVAGGNVCAIAKKRGIAGFIIDGVIRDIAEIREMRFPVFARGVYPKPGIKGGAGDMRSRIYCGGVAVAHGDIIVADEEGIVITHQVQEHEILEKAKKHVEKQNQLSLDQWEQAHRRKIDQIVDK